MTPLKKVLIASAVVVALIALAIGLAFTAPVQKWALKRALPGAEAERVSAGMSSAEVRNLTFVQDGARITVPAASAEYSAWGYLTGSGIRIGKVDARGIVIDLRNHAPKEATAGPAGFEGIFAAAALPPGLQLGSADIGVEVILPAPGDPEGRRVLLTVKGGGVGAGSDAAFDYSATFNDPSKDAPVSKLNASGRLTFTVTADGAMDNISAKAELQAEGEGIPKGERIVFDASANRSGGAAESFQIGIARRDAAGGDTSLVTAAGEFNPATKALAGAWTLSVDNERLAAVLPAQTTPEFDVSGSGKFAVNAGTGESTASGEIKGSVAGLERVMADLGSVGRIAFSAAFGGAADSKEIRIESVSARVTRQDGTPLLAVSTLQAIAFNPESGALSFEDPSKDLATMEISDVPVAWAAPFVEGYKLQGGTIAGAFLVQSTPAGDRVQLRASKPLLIGAVTVADDTQTLLEQATISASPEVSYTAGRIEAAIPSWSIATAAGDRIEGTARAVIVQGVSPSADFNVTLTGRLPAMLKRFSPVDVGTVGIEGGAEGSASSGKLALRTGRLVVQGAAGATLLSVELRQPLDLDLATMQPAVKDASSPAASVSFGSLPLGWAEPFVQKSAFGGVVESGAIDLTLATDGRTVATTEPIVLRAVSIALDGEQLIDRLDLAWDGTAAMTGRAMNANVRSLDVRQGATQLLAMKGVVESNGETDPKLIRATAKGTLVANIGALLAQPAAAQWRVLEAGTVSASFDVAAAGSTKVALKVEAKGLVAKQDRTPLGDATVTVDATVTPGNDGEFRVPLTVVNSGRKSDVTLSGRFAQRDEKVTLNVLVAGDTIHLDDFKALAALAPPDAGGASTQAAPAGPRNTTRDTEPFWTGADGTFDIDIKNLVGATDKPITNLKARAVMVADRLAIESFTGNAAGGEVTASGSIRFIAADPAPYALESKFKVPGLDMAAFFAAEAPGKPPTLETVVVAEGTATGRGLNLDDLVARLQGRIDVTGGKGVYRGLARSSDLVSTGAGLLGALLGGQKVQDATQAVSELATQLRELRFDRMNLKIARGGDLKLNIETLELLSSTMRLSGKGVVNMDPDLPLARQSQRLEMRIGFKDTLGERMIARRMTDGTVDDLGYARFRVPILLTGNLLSPDSKQFWEAVTRSMMEMGVQSFMGGG